MADCLHHWKVPGSDGRMVLPGVCAKCGTEQTRLNVYPPDLDDKGVAALAVVAAQPTPGSQTALSQRVRVLQQAAHRRKKAVDHASPAQWSDEQERRDRHEPDLSIRDAPIVTKDMDELVRAIRDHRKARRYPDPSTDAICLTCGLPGLHVHERKTSD